MTRDDSEAPVAAQAQEPESPGTLTTVTGISASITRSALDAEVLRVVDADGRLLFEHNTSTPVTVIVAPEGDPSCTHAPRGKVKIVAAEGFELDTPVAPREDRRGPGGGPSLSATFERVKSAVGVIETRAERIIERAKNTYREVEELSQTRAGRLRHGRREDRQPCWGSARS
ncbi:MAG: hypothetical protein IPN17_28675 [Deltaproteobacteria bacterium]|nr:hypothetical protein [Deltaproteobacteria bacterium]